MYNIILQFVVKHVGLCVCVFVACTICTWHFAARLLIPLGLVMKMILLKVSDAENRGYDIHIALDTITVHPLIKTVICNSTQMYPVPVKHSMEDTKINHERNPDRKH